MERSFNSNDNKLFNCICIMQCIKYRTIGYPVLIDMTKCENDGVQLAFHLYTITWIVQVNL